MKLPLVPSGRREARPASNYCLSESVEFRIVTLICYCQAAMFYRRLLPGLVLAVTIAGCVTPARHVTSLAYEHGLSSVLLRGTIFQHHAFWAAREASDLLVLFIDGDGSPWVHG